jgi:hypothetical protein
MYARAVDDAGERLRRLRHEAWGDFGLAAVALGLALVASRTRSEFVLPLFIGGLAVAALGVRAEWRRWDLVERLAGDGDAHSIPEVRAYAAQHATMERRRSFASLIRCYLEQPGLPGYARLAAVADELEALACELDDAALDLHPVSAVACLRLLSDVAESPLLNPALPAEDVRARTCRIRSGFQPRPLTAPVAEPTSADPYAVA